MDSGCEGAVIREDECIRLDIKIKPLDSTDTLTPTQADGKTLLDIVGKAKFIAERDKLTFQWEGYVSKSVQSAILCGGAFMECNEIIQELKERRIKVANKHYIMESHPLCPPTSDIYTRSVNAETAGVTSDSNLGFQKNVPLLNSPATNPVSSDSSLPTTLSSKSARDDILKKIDIGESLSSKTKEKLFSIHSQNISVFDGDLRCGYNGFSGDHTVDFNFKNDVRPPVHFGCVPSYNKREDDVLMQAMIDTLEDKKIVAKANAIGIIPRYASPTMLVLKNSARALSKDTFSKMSIPEKLKFHRMVLCQNKLNDYVEKIPHKYNTLDDTIRIVGSFQFVITTDLTDSFWQRHIAEDKLPYFAFHSPFKGTYIFLRSSQGFLNQSEGLEALVSSVLEDFVGEGWCRVHADNIYVLGHDENTTVNRWQQVLEAMKKNNIKLSAKKTQCFPAKLDLLGWCKEGKLLTPDPHRQNCVSIAPLPKTAKQLRSYIGSFRTFQKCREDTAFILKDLELFLAENSSVPTAVLPWTEPLIKQFEESKVKIKTLDKLYLPKQDDQLVLTSDWCKDGISATLWAVVDEKFHVVARMSSRVGRPNDAIMPCDGEATAVFIAAKCSTFSIPIKASSLKTIALVDNKTVVQASKLIEKGKFSSSKVINEIVTGISELNLDYHHISGKMGENFADDYGSRNPVKCEGGDHCKVCSFVRDSKLVSINSVISFVATNDAIIASIAASVDNQLVNDIIRGTTPIPFSNRKAMKYLQDQDPDLQIVRRELTSGQRPQLKNTKVNSIKRYLQKQANITIAKDGLLVSRKMGRKFSTKDLIVIPENVSRGLLYGMHLNLKHPTSFQLKKVIDTKFFMLNKDTIIDGIQKSCEMCQSLAQIPKEMENFKANEVPDHPGMAFTLDVMKYCNKTVVVATDNFSGFLSTVMIKSEQHDQLMEGLILTVLPFKTSSLSNVRVDQAPGFKKLKLNKTTDLAEIGIILELGEAKNKNSLALVDRKMQELQNELKKIAPSNNTINVKILAHATAIVNERVRGSGFSSKELLFSRDQVSQENLALDDEEIAKKKMDQRLVDNQFSSKSKASVQKQSKRANAKPGQLVFLKDDGDKLSRRELYLVLDIKESDETLNICKLLHTISNKVATLQPHNITYRVKQSDVFLAPNQPVEIETHEFEDPPPFIPHQNFHPPPLSTATEFPTKQSRIKKERATIETSDEDDDDEDDDDEGDDDGNVDDDHYSDGDDDIEDEDWQKQNQTEENYQNVIAVDDYDDENEDEANESEPEAELEEESIEGEYDADEELVDDEEHQFDERVNTGNAEVANHEELENEKEPSDQDEEEGADQQIIVANEHEIDENNQGAAAKDPVRVIENQSKKPAKGDIIAFVKGSFWIRAKVNNKVAGYPHYYNIQYEDGELDGLYLNPPSKDGKESWTFIKPELWAPSPTVIANIADLNDPPADANEGINQLDGADTPDSLSPSSTSEAKPYRTPPIPFQNYSRLASREEINNAPLRMGIQEMGVIILDNKKPAEDEIVTVSNDVSMDWDNYNSDPTFISTESNLFDFNVNNLDISSETTGSDVATLHHDQAFVEDIHHPQADRDDDQPVLHRRADRTLSVINCGANTCKPKNI